MRYDDDLGESLDNFDNLHIIFQCFFRTNILLFYIINTFINVQTKSLPYFKLPV